MDEEIQINNTVSILRNLIKKTSSKSFIELNCKDFKEVTSWISTSKLCSIVLDMNEIEIIGQGKYCFLLYAFTRHSGKCFLIILKNMALCMIVCHSFSNVKKKFTAYVFCQLLNLLIKDFCLF